MSISTELFRELEKMSEPSTRNKILAANMSSYSSELEGLFTKLADFQRRETVETFERWAYVIGDERIRELKNKIADIIHSITTGSSMSSDDFEIALNPLYGDVVKIVTPMLRSESDYTSITIWNIIAKSIGNDKAHSLKESNRKFGELLNKINDNEAKIYNYKYNDLFFSLAKKMLNNSGTNIETLEEFKEIQALLESKAPILEMRAEAKELNDYIVKEKSEFEKEKKRIYEQISDRKQFFNAEKSEAHSEKIKNTYENLRDQQNTINGRWLWATIVFFILTCFFIALLWIYTPQLSDLPYHISAWQFFLYVSPRLVLCALSIAAIVWCAKMYKIGKNIEETYLRIAMGINTTIQMTDGDTEQRNKHFPKLIESFFTLPDSGYITGKDAPSFISQVAGLFQNKS